MSTYLPQPLPTIKILHTGPAVASGTTTESRSSETPPGLDERAKAEPARPSTTIEVKMMHSSFDG